MKLAHRNTAQALSLGRLLLFPARSGPGWRWCGEVLDSRIGFCYTDTSRGSKDALAAYIGVSRSLPTAKVRWVFLTVGERSV